jgi:hypothetical protein
MSHWINLTEFGDTRGKLVSIENMKNIPFKMERLFYIYDTDSDAIRGKHANRNSSFIFICVSGACDISIDNGQTVHDYQLDLPTKALYCPKGTWKEMVHFKPGTVLLVISDQPYDNSEYIRDYTEFKEYCKSHG